MTESPPDESSEYYPTLREHIRDSWTDLTEPELDWVGNHPDRLASALSQKYGISRDEAARQVWHFLEELKDDDSSVAAGGPRAPLTPQSAGGPA